MDIFLAIPKSGNIDYAFEAAFSTRALAEEFIDAGPEADRFAIHVLTLDGKIPPPYSQMYPPLKRRKKERRDGPAR